MKMENEGQVPLPLLVLRLRSLVLTLGESVRPAWWKTEFMNETGLRFLERLYPRSSFRAAVYAAGKAACEVHDRAVGRVGVYHLFRLPEFLEAEIHVILPSADEDFVTQFRSSLGRPDRLREMLGSLGEGGDGKDNAPGPRRIGTEADLTTLPAFRTAASVYRCAFDQGKPAFPYFAAEQSRADG